MNGNFHVHRAAAVKCYYKFNTWAWAKMPSTRGG